MHPLSQRFPTMAQSFECSLLTYCRLWWLTGYEREEISSKAISRNFSRKQLQDDCHVSSWYISCPDRRKWKLECKLLWSSRECVRPYFPFWFQSDGYNLDCPGIVCVCASKWKGGGMTMTQSDTEVWDMTLMELIGDRKRTFVTF